MSAPPTTRTVELDGLAFDVDVDGPGDGPTAVLLHGFPQDRRSWREVRRRLHPLGVRTVAFDQRGYAPTARPADDAAYTLDRLAGDVVGVADALGLERWHVVGHDWGGAVAWALGSRAPRGLASVTSLSTPHPSAMAWAVRHADQARRSRYMRLFASSAGPRVLGGAGALGLRGLFAGSGLRASLAGPYVQRARSDPGWLDAALAWYRANSVATPGVVGSVALPTLFAWGDADPALGAAAAYRTGHHVDGPYRFEVLPGAGHWLPELAADAVARLVGVHVTVVEHA